MLSSKQKETDEGDQFVSRLSFDLKRKFPGTNEFSPKNLEWMRKFAEAYPYEALVQKVFAHIPWEHNLSLLKRLTSRPQRVWYARKSTEYGWSHNILEIQIEGNRLDRQGQSNLDFEQTLPPEGSDLSRQLLKNQHSLSFLMLKEACKEKTLKQALTNHIRDFLLDLRVGFAFAGSQYRLDVGETESFIDMLFYHIYLRRFVAISLETTDFEPEMIGKMNFFVNVVNDKLAEDDHQPTIGIILCKSQDRTVVKYALDGLKAPIGVSTYGWQGEIPSDLRDALPTVRQLEGELEMATQEFEPSEKDFKIAQ